MPNRILKESICTSENLNLLSNRAELLFYRLIVNCDDYGRMDGRPVVILSKCFPLKVKQIEESDVSKWLQELSDASLIKVYFSANLPFIQMSTWEKHQQVRAKRSKYPSPDSNSNQLIANDSICPRNPIQSESLSESLSEAVSDKAATPDKDNKIKLILKKESGKLRDATESDFLAYIEETKAEFPDLDCEVEFKRFELWWSEGRKEIKRPKTAWHNWLIKARQIKEEHGNGKKSGRDIPKHYTDPDAWLRQRQAESDSPTGAGQ